MDIDVDWCLTCQRHIEGSHPYCSSYCQIRAAPPTIAVPNHDDDDRYSEGPSRSSTSSRWLGNDTVGIAAWAADIPPNAPPTLDAACPQPAPQRAQNLYKTRRAPPNLLNSPRRAAPPCLSTSSTLPADSSHSSPVVTSSRQPSPDGAQSSKRPTLSKTSSKSAQTESPLSTPSTSHHQSSIPIFCPSRKSSILDDMYIHVRSWVAPAIFVPVKLPLNQRQPLPLQRVDSSSKYQLTIHPPLANKFLATEKFLGRGRLLPELALNDAHPPSFRARGRKASRAAA